MVFWCGGGLLSAPDSLTGRGWDRFFLNTASEGTLESFLVRFRGLSVLHCHSVLVSGFSVLHCHGVLVWRKAVFSTGFSTTGKGWKRLLFDFVACPSITAMVFWCGGGLFSVLESVQREKVGKK